MAYATDNDRRAGSRTRSLSTGSPTLRRRGPSVAKRSLPSGKSGAELVTEQAQRLARLCAGHRRPVRIVSGWHRQDISAAIAKWILRNTGL
ncbi:hypothetical protein GCM10010448_71140 [Streptomyces glomeratus]|uniref:Uncharacterized protein n=1 Tax=Streptomyces glomeratus TaxID=284452 RepID=A0ABP6M797_9ACTN